MQIIPAIDLIGGKCVRLTEGDFNQKKEYNNNPLEVALKFKEYSAQRIHIVDLDGAKTGTSINREVIKNIKKETGLIIETGGGIRTEEDVNELLEGNIDYLILGTILVTDIKTVEKWVSKYPDRFIAGIDAKDGNVMTRGWTKDEGIDALDFGKKMLSIGFKQSVYTDISKDGKLQGPNIEGTKLFTEKTGLDVILSGGVTSIDDIKKTYELNVGGIIGTIVGKAYYEGKINLTEAIEKYGR